MKFVYGFLAVAGLAIVGCGGGGGFDVEACTAAQDAFNTAAGDCITGWTDSDWGCEAIGAAADVAGTTCDYEAYYAYYADITCDTATGSITYPDGSVPVPTCE